MAPEKILTVPQIQAMIVQIKATIYDRRSEIERLEQSKVQFEAMLAGAQMPKEAE